MPPPTHRRLLPLFAAVLACIGIAVAGSAGAATSNTVVSMSVPSATSLDVSTCTGSPTALSFGVILPGTSGTTSDCTIQFGSSNDTSALRLSQVDGRGPALVRPFDGPADTSFATGGTYAIDPSAGNDVFWDAIEMPDGDILLSGHYQAGAGDGGMLLARLAPNGAPRAGFGTNGVITTNDRVGDQMAWTVAARPDGSFFVGADRAGSTAVGLFSATGVQDMSWGGDGWLELPHTPTPRVMRVIRDGSILMAGTAYWPTVDCVITKIRSNGTLDTGFGSSGSVRVGPDQTYCDGFDVDIQGRGIIAAQNGSDVLLARITTTGQVDTTYGGGIRRFDPEGTTTYYYDVVVLPDGGTLFGGYSDGSVLLSRYDANGAPVTSFGGDGHLRLAAHAWSVRDLAWVDGRIVVVGDYGNSRVLRLMADGSPDPSYSSDGVDDPSVPGSTEDNGLLVMGDGRALLFGANGTSAQAMMLRAASVADYDGGTTDWDQGAGFFGACLRAVSASGDPTWSLNAGCTTSDGGWWNDVPRDPETVATSDYGQAATTATLRFGMRVPTTQAPGSYVAPIRVEVVAPAA